ncbi:MAG: translocation/assembly module TamB domain-containing protein [Rhodospirillaceae bacterium]
MWRVLIGVAALIVLIVAGVGVVVGTAPGSRWVVDRALEAAGSVRAASVEGTLLDRLTLHGVEVADNAGTWLTADTVTVDWQLARLLGGRLWIDQLVAREVHVARPPEPGVETSQEGGSGFDLSQLERLTLRQLDLDGVHVAEPVLGAPINFRAAGLATGTEQGGIDAQLEARRLDAPGEARVEVRHRPGGVLGVHVAAFEPEGGAIARLLDLPGLPAVRLSLNGEGPVGQWQGALLAEAEDFVTVEADLTLSLAAARTASLAGTARPGPLMPGEITAATGETLEFAATVRQDSGFAVENLRLRGAGWTLGGAGGVDEGAQVAGQAVLDITDGAGFALLIGVPVGQGRLETRVQGPLDRMDVALDASLVGTVVRTAEVRARAVVGGEVTPFSAEGRVGGVSELVPEAAPLVGEGLDFAVTGTVRLEDSEIAVERLTVQSPVMGAEYVGAIALAPLGVAGGLEASITDLAALEPLTGIALRGVGTVAADLRADQETIVGGLRILLRDFATGIAQADALVAGQVDAASTVRWRGEEIILSDLRLRAPGASLDASMAMTGFEVLDGTFVLEASDLARLDLGVEGAARAEGRIGGTLGAPELTAAVGGKDVRVAGLDVRQPSAGLRLTGQQVDLSDVRARIAGVQVAGRLAVPFDTALLDGAFSLDLQAPEELATLTGQPITGRLVGDVTFAPMRGTQGLSARLNGEALALPEAGVALRSVQAQADLSDLFGAPRGRIDVTAGEGGAGTVMWQDALLRADLSDGAGAFSVTVRGPPTTPYTAEAGGRLTMAEATAIRLNTLRVANPDHAVRMTAPTTLTLTGGDIDLGPTRLDVDGGTLAVEARLAGGAVDLSVTGRNLPMTVLELAVTDYPVEGMAALDVRLTGPLRRPTGRIQLRTSPLAIPEAGVEGLVVEVDGDIAGGRLSGQARLSGIAPEPAVMTADVPVAFSDSGIPSIPETQPLSAAIDWHGPVQSVWALVPQIGHRVAGQAVVQARVTGTLAAPQYSGEAAMVDGSYENFEWGTVLRDLRFTAGLTPNGDVSLQASATDGGSGRVTLDGTIDNSQADISLVRARVALQQVQAVRRDDLQAGVSGEVSYEGTFDEGTVRGDLSTETVRLTLGAALGGGIPELDVVEVNSAAIGDPERVSVAAEGGGPAFGSAIALDVRVRMPNRIYVTGQGLDSEWQGQLTLGGTLAEARIVGALQVVRGTFAALNRSFALETGTVEFTGGEEIDPTVAVRAVHKAEEITAIVEISGLASDPTVALDSRPSLPEDEIISRVLFGRGMGALGPAEGVAVAQMAARMAGIGGGGPGVLEQMRGALSLDVLSVGGGADGPTVEAGRYVGENVYVGVERGAGTDSTSVEVEVELTPNVTLETRGSARSGADIGVQWKFDY